MEPEEKLGNVKARPIWLVALIPLLGIVWGMVCRQIHRLNK